MGKWKGCAAALLLTFASGSAQAYVIPPEPLLDLGGGIEVFTGGWTATGAQWNTGRGPATLVQLSLRAGRRGDLRHSFSRLTTDLSGLTPDAISAASRDVRFEILRDAGSLRFEGRFQAGAGSGTFVFVPAAAYLNGLRAHGYQGIDAEKAYILAVHDVSRPFIDDLASLGYLALPFEQLLALRIHGADPAFVRAMRAAGYEKLTAEDLVALSIHGARPEFAAELKRLGYPRLETEQLVSFKIHGVTADFIRELQAFGYGWVSPDDLVNLRVHGVNADFVKRVNLNRGAPAPLTRLVDLRLRSQAP